MKDVFVRLGVLLACLAAAATPSRGAVELVYFTESPRGLYNFDTTSGVSTLRAAMTGTARFFAMDRRPSDGALFAVDLLSGGLWNINIDTGAQTRIGTLSPAIDRPEGISFQPGTGNLYVDSVNGDLYKVDPGTAATTLVGHSGLTINGNSFTPGGDRMLAFRQGAGGLYSVNPATGAATFVGTSIPSSVAEDSTFTPGGQFYGTDYHGAIYRVNPATGAATFIANTGFGDGLLGLFAAVPEPSAGAIVAACACGGGGGALARRRLPRRRTRGRPIKP